MIQKREYGTIFLFSLFLIFFSSNTLAQKIEIKANQLTLNGNLELAEGKQLSDGVVLLTHGTLAHNGMEIIAGMQSLLLENEVSSLTINLGLGIDNREQFYDCKTPHIHHHEDAVNEIQSWVDWLVSQGAKSIVLAGHSRGGNQTAWFASESDLKHIDKVVLVAPMVWDKEDTHKEYQEKYNKPLKDILAKARSLAQKSPQPQFLEHTDFIYCKDTKVSADAFISYYKDEPRMDTPSLLKKITKPVLVIAGSEDKVVAGLVEKTEPLVDDKNLFLINIDGAGHMFRDLYLEELIEGMLEFLQN